MGHEFTCIALQQSGMLCTLYHVRIFRAFLRLHSDLDASHKWSSNTLLEGSTTKFQNV